MQKASMSTRIWNHIHHYMNVLGLFLFLITSAFVQSLDPDSRLSSFFRQQQNALGGSSEASDLEQAKAEQAQRSEWLGSKATEVSRTLQQAGVRHATVYNRVKSIESATEKTRRKGLASVDQLNDLYGMRIVVENELDVYRSLNVVCKNYETVPGTLKNYIIAPKASGYQSVHVVNELDGKRVEFQIRTIAMHEQAEAEHEAYKKRVRVA